MTVTLILLATGLACLVYWAAQWLPKEPPPPTPPRRAALHPLELLLERELAQAKLPLTPQQQLWLILAASGLGLILASPFRSGALMLISAIAFGMAPYSFVRMRAQRRSRDIQAAIEPAFIQIAKLCEVRHHPFLALSDAVPMLEGPLKPAMEEALAETRVGLPLPDALRQMAAGCCDNFYLYQLAELVAINIREGGDLPGSIHRLVSRLRAMEELRAEGAAELFGYEWLTQLLFGASLLPLPYWALTGSTSLDLFLTDPAARALLVWVVLSGLAVASLPYWLALDD